MRLRLSVALLMLASIGSAAVAADHPGQTFNISPNALAKPYATPSAANSAIRVPRPANALPAVPPGFKASLYVSGLADPRWLAVAPNGDVFLAQPNRGTVSLLRETKDGVQVTSFATGFDRPHGLAVANGALYVGDMNAVWRIPLTEGDAKTAKRERVTTARNLSPGGHWTRDLAVDPKGTVYVGIGSNSNVAEDPPPYATVQTVGKDGALKPFAAGLRNPVGLAFYPGTDDLFVTVNERDGLGDALVPDYLTHLQPGGFYGWPYAYLGNHPDPDYGKKRPDLVAKAIVPDLLFQAHSAPLGLAFYTATQFPERYRGGAFVALHGSWNSGAPTGYKVVFVPFKGARPSGGYENFLTGFWDGNAKPGPPAHVWGRPAGLAIAKDGSLLIADDTGKAVWRVRYAGGK